MTSRTLVRAPLRRRPTVKHIKRHEVILFVLITVTLIYLALENASISPEPLFPNQVASASASASTNTSKETYLTFYLRMYHGTFNFYSHYWFPSLQLFWPSQLWRTWLIQNNYNPQISILIVMDNESSRCHETGKRITSLFNNAASLSHFFNLTVLYEDKPLQFGLDKMRGHDRQQWSMFYIDTIATNSKFVAIMDTDSMFQTIALPQYLFTNDKPIIIGSPQLKSLKGFDNKYFSFWKRVPRNTVKWLKIEKEPLKCMTYFPVIIRTKHLQLMRHRIASIHNLSFGEVFAELYHEEGRSVWSQFNVFCSYLWHYHKNEYFWYINRGNQISNSSSYFIEKTNPAFPALSFEELYFEYNTRQYSEYISFEPGIHVMTHVKYMNNDWHIQYKNALFLGYCFCVNFMGCNKTEIKGILKDGLPYARMSNVLISQLEENDLLKVNPYLFYFDQDFGKLFLRNITTVSTLHYSSIRKYLKSYHHRWNFTILDQLFNFYDFEDGK